MEFQSKRAILAARFATSPPHKHIALKKPYYKYNPTPNHCARAWEYSPVATSQSYQNTTLQENDNLPKRQENAILVELETQNVGMTTTSNHVAEQSHMINDYLARKIPKERLSKLTKMQRMKLEQDLIISESNKEFWKKYRRMPQSYLMVAVVVMIFINPPFGLVATLISLRAVRAWENGDVRHCKYLAKVSVVISLMGILTLGIAVILVMELVADTVPVQVYNTPKWLFGSKNKG